MENITSTTLTGSNVISDADKQVIIQQAVQQVLAQLYEQSTQVSTLEKVESLNGLTSIPAVRNGIDIVAVPLRLLTPPNLEPIESKIAAANSASDILSKRITGLFPSFRGSVGSIAEVAGKPEGIYLAVAEECFVDHEGNSDFADYDHYNGSDGRAREDKIFLRSDGTLHRYEGVLVKIADMNDVSDIRSQLSPCEVDSEAAMQALVTSGKAIAGRVYFTSVGKVFIWNGASVTVLGNSLKIGESADSAFGGDKGAVLATKVVTLEEDTAAHTDAIGGLQETIGAVSSTLATKADKSIVAAIEQIANDASQKATLASNSINAAVVTASEAKAKADSFDARIAELEARPLPRTAFEELASEAEWQARKDAGTLSPDTLYYIAES